jgi:hypothetical protein
MTAALTISLTETETRALMDVLSMHCENIEADCEDETDSPAYVALAALRDRLTAHVAAPAPVVAPTVQEPATVVQPTVARTMSDKHRTDLHRVWTLCVANGGMTRLSAAPTALITRGLVVMTASRPRRYFAVTTVGRQLAEQIEAERTARKAARVVAPDLREQCGLASLRSTEAA